MNINLKLVGYSDIGFEGKHHPQWYFRIPLGWWKSENYRMEFLATTKGWHWHYLLVVIDRSPKLEGWRWQRQRMSVPLTHWEYHR